MIGSSDGVCHITPFPALLHLGLIDLETPCASPPDELILEITTLPLSLVEQDIRHVDRVPPPDAIPPGHTRDLHMRDASPQAATPTRKILKRIETPSWVFVKPGEDDKEEAKEELERSGRSPSLSPIKRLRKDEVGAGLPPP